ncbi:MAG: hypothetical protein LC620_08195 [Halobacteriales archaeon]|nr:hypothetical protein [Halobacteriales archaeon]
MEKKEVQSLILTLAGPGPMVVPLRIGLALSAGSGALHLEAIQADRAWRESAGCAWAQALSLTGRTDVDGTVTVAGKTPLHGSSASLTLGLLALAALLDDTLPPHFATGEVLPDGMLVGGAALRPKLAAAAAYAPQLGRVDPAFLCPATAGPAPCPPGIRLLHATDLTSAYALLSPASHKRIAARYHAVRSAHSSA